MRHGGTYGSFIAAPIGPDLGPFIQGRVNDHTTESKRIEVYRLPQADNKAKFRLRFALAGTASWFWGVDNIGLYSIAPKAPPARPTLVAPSTAQFFSDNVILTGSAFSASDPAQVHSSSVWQAAVSGAFDPDTGLANPLFQVTSGTQLTSFMLPLERFFPGQSVQLTVRYQDGLGNKSQFAAPQTMLVGTTFPTLVPGTFEDFETTVEFEAPAGWFRENQSDAVSFPDWTVVSEATLLGFAGNRTNTPDVFTGNTLYGASDGQQGNQIQYITTPEFNLTGYTQTWVAYKSNYMQNQDSFGGLEFTTNDGVTWQPVVLMIDEADILRMANGTVDPTATLTTTYDDLAKVFLEDGVTRVDAGKFEDFILTRPIDGLAPFISGRVQDDEFESKRYQRYRIAGADNQAKVKFRFAHTGDDSWFWGIDDFGVYSFSPAGRHFHAAHHIRAICRSGKCRRSIHRTKVGLSRRKELHSAIVARLQNLEQPGHRRCGHRERKPPTTTRPCRRAKSSAATAFENSRDEPASGLLISWKLVEANWQECVQRSESRLQPATRRAAPSDKARAEPFRSAPHRLKAALRTRAPKNIRSRLKPGLPTCTRLIAV